MILGSYLKYVQTDFEELTGPPKDMYFKMLIGCLSTQKEDIKHKEDNQWWFDNAASLPEWQFNDGE